MSEREPTFESGRNVELDPKELEKLSKDNYERLREDAERASEKSNDTSLEAIQERIEKAAKSKEDIEAPHSEINGSEASLLASTHLTEHAYKRKLKMIQRQESRPQRAFSKVVHSPIVETVSDAAEGTVARPSGLLFAGLFAAISGIVVLYICRHYGYEYNFMISLVCLGVGFVAGLILEGLWRLIRRPSRS